MNAPFASAGSVHLASAATVGHFPCMTVPPELEPLAPRLLDDDDAPPLDEDDDVDVDVPSPRVGYTGCTGWPSSHAARTPRDTAKRAAALGSKTRTMESVDDRGQIASMRTSRSLEPFAGPTRPRRSIVSTMRAARL